MNARAAPDDPVVSVVLIFFNEARFVEEAINSVIAQTFRNWELLLVDDGSSDGSADIARRYASVFPVRIRYLAHTGGANRGPSASRNLGIQHARGSFLAFLDGDDVWLPQKLAEQLPMLEREPTAAMLYGHSQQWYSWTNKPEDATRDHVPNVGADTGVALPGASLLADMVTRRVLTPCPSSMLVRRNTVAAIGGFEDRFRNVYEDQVFTAKMCLAAPVLIAATTWDLYRQHADSAYAVARGTGENLVARITFLEWLQSYLSERQSSDSALASAVTSELQSATAALRERSGHVRSRTGGYRAALRSILHKLRSANAQP